jgi:hypothetical protein
MLDCGLLKDLRTGSVAEPSVTVARSDAKSETRTILGQSAMCQEKKDGKVYCSVRSTIPALSHLGAGLIVLFSSFYGFRIGSLL